MAALCGAAQTKWPHAQEYRPIPKLSCNMLGKTCTGREQTMKTPGKGTKSLALALLFVIGVT